MIKIPNTTKQFFQSNRSDILGSIWSSFNLDLTSNLGKLRISPRGMLTCKSTDSGLENLGVATAFRVLGTSASANYGIWACAGTKMFKNSGAIYGNFVEDVTTGTPTLDSSFDQDLEIFNGKLYVSGLANGDLAFLDTSGDWSTTATTDLIAGSMVVYGNRLYYVLNTSSVGSTIDGTTLVAPSGNPNTVINSINLGNFGGESRNTITCLRASSNRIWIATINKSGGKGRIYEWDGASVDPTRYYTLESAGALAMTIKDDVPWIMDVDGRLLAYNGGAFIEKARLPVKDSRYLKNPFDSDAKDRFIHFNGMSVSDDRVLFLINNENEDYEASIQENLPSGIWEYHDTTGLYHKKSLSSWVYLNSTEETDYGFNRINSVGAIFSLKSTSNASNYNGSILCGAGYYSDATTVVYGTFIDDTNDTVVKTGYIVTPEIQSSNIHDDWNRFIAFHNKFLNDADDIKVKYRIETQEPIEVTGTWDTVETFKTTTDLTLKVGYEVEILSGKGSGMVAHIKSVSYDNVVYTVTLDESLTGVNGTFKARIQNWTLLVPKNLLDYKEFTVGKVSKWVQFKVFCKWTGKNEINELQIFNEKHK